MNVHAVNHHTSLVSVNNKYTFNKHTQLTCKPWEQNLVNDAWDEFNVRVIWANRRILASVEYQ